MIRRTVYRSVAFRITLSLAILFGLVSAAGMLSIYFGVTQHLRNAVDAELVGDRREFTQNLALYNYDAATLEELFRKETGDEGPDRKFYCLISANYETIASSDMSSWPSAQFMAARIVDEMRKDAALHTLMLAGDRETRIIAGRTGDGRLLLIGVVPDRNSDFLAYFRYATLLALAGVLIVGTAGSILNYYTVKKDIIAKQQLEARLIQAQKMQAIGTLAGGIAHDFNNILAAMLGYTELAVMKTEKESKIRRDLQEVLKAGARATDLVKQILTFARQSEMEKRPVQISVVVKEVLKLLRASFPTTIEMKQSIESEALAMADPTQIHQILMNLCTNSKLAMPDGGRLDVSLGEVDLDEEFASRHPGIKPGIHLQLTVSDTGAGMTKEVIERIFDPFFTTRESGEGTGMGLSVVHGIVRASEGTITVYSEPNEGTTFNVFLPVAGEMGCATKESTLPLPTGTERILLVDDEEVLVDMTKAMLQRLGYSVTSTTNSLEALNRFREEPDAFDLVISDMTMPNLAGDTLAGHLMLIRDDIPIILCSGYSERMDAESAKAIGIEGFMPKPIAMSVLARTVRSVLDDECDGQSASTAELSAVC